MKFVLNHFKVSNLSVITRQHIKKCQVHVIFALKFLNQVGISSNTKVQYTVVHTENIFNYNECPKKFSTTANLRDHVKKTHEKVFVECSICKERLCSTKLKRHEISCEKRMLQFLWMLKRKKKRLILVKNVIKCLA